MSWVRDLDAEDGWWLDRDDDDPDAGGEVPTGVDTGARYVRWQQADDGHAVVSRSGGKGTHMRQPCAKCPWRVDATGEFPAQAFRLSAHTAYDAAMETFGCHETASSPNPVTCAGFLLKNSENNLGVRLRLARGDLDLDTVHDGGHELYDSYREMAEANGVDPEDPALANCRPDEARIRERDYEARMRPTEEEQ